MKKPVLLAIGFLAAHCAIGVPDGVSSRGGRLVRPDSGKGKIVLVNAQDKIAAKVIEKVRDEIVSDLNCRVEIAKAPRKVNPQEIKDSLGATIALIIVDEEKSPISLVALEDRWAVVNVAKFPAGSADMAGKEMLRTFAVVAGAYVSQFPDTLMSVTNTASMKDVEFYLTPDIGMRTKTYLESIGVTTLETASYRRACQEGWAPAPTNDVQKKIWNDVHAMPKNPMKIEFDPKKGR